MNTRAADIELRLVRRALQRLHRHPDSHAALRVLAEIRALLEPRPPAAAPDPSRKSYARATEEIQP